MIKLIIIIYLFVSNVDTNHYRMFTGMCVLTSEQILETSC